MAGLGDMFSSKYVLGIIEWKNPIVILCLIGVGTVLFGVGFLLYFLYEHLYWR